MSVSSRRLQVASGPSNSSVGYGRRLPQGGFQSIDATYAAQDRCKILPPGTISDEFGLGIQDVDASDMPDNPTEDDNDDSAVVLGTTTSTTNDDNGSIEREDTFQTKETIVPQLSTKGHVQLPADFHDDD